MWIALSILSGLAILVTALFLSPVKILIQNDEQNELMLRYKFWFKTFGEHPDPDDPITKMLWTASGASRLKKTNLQKNIRSDGLQKTVTESYKMLIDLLKELAALLKYCTLTKLHVKIRSVGDGADEAAIHYGQYSAVTYSLLSVLQEFLKIRKRGCNIDISCDFMGTEGVFHYEAVLTIRLSRVLAAFWRTVLAESKRVARQRVDQQK